VMNRLVRNAGQAVPLAFLVPLVYVVPLVPPSPAGIVPLNGINGALMPFPRHRWNIDVVTRRADRVAPRATGTDAAAGMTATSTIEIVSGAAPVATPPSPPGTPFSPLRN
jgi:hypothetical protein